MSDTSHDDEVLFRVEDTGVAWITLNRPEKGNAIAPPNRDRIISLLNGVTGDASVRAVVITGTGDRHFSTGGDLRHPDAFVPADLPPRPVGDVVRLISHGVQRLMISVLDCDKPVIAAVNGTAAGIGAHLAFACDLVVAADDARFIELFVRRGLVPDGAGAYLLTRLIGAHQAKELLFFGDDLPAVEAARLGLVNRLVPRAEVRDFAGAWAERLATGPTVAIGLAKGLVNRALDHGRTSALRDEAMAVEINSRSADFDEGLSAFVNRRPVSFTGR
jgi:2-(1,2-epoxy-1,2-dihydrophenyl)acetyl-CoA isomerase